MTSVPATASTWALALLAAGAIFLACGSAPALQGSESSATVTGNAVAQGRSNPQDIRIEVFREPRPARGADQSEVRVEVVAEGLEVPWALDFAPDGRILVTERPGRIRVVQDGALLEQPLATLEVAHVSEAGLMGLALDPEFESNRYVYVCYTYRNSGGQLMNRIARLADPSTGLSNEGLPQEHRVILDGIPGARNHNGCRLGFGPDGMLYATTGDAQHPPSAQDPASLAGKVLRMTPEGEPPGDNPFPGSYVYTLGHRNPQGMDWHPVTGDLFITGHGPQRDDEINILEPGGNYGWPTVLGKAGEAGFVDPVLTFTPTVALAGGAFYTGTQLPQPWPGSFVFANLKGSHLRRLTLDPAGHRTVSGQESLFQGDFGRLRAVSMGPDGRLYFTTSNRDGRGDPAPNDDRILRLALDQANPDQPEVDQEEAVATVNPDASGGFRLELPPGSYRLRLSLPGFLAVELPVDVPAGQVRIDLGKLELRAGDLDGNGRVDRQDLALMQAAFARAAAAGPGTQPAQVADLSGDGSVDVTDLALLGSNWGAGR